MPKSHGLRFDETRFWVIYRRIEYGPFDYDWSADLSGMELLYRGEKFGEICNAHELFADLKEYGLPMRVVEVASLVLGCMILGIAGGFSQAERQTMLAATLAEFDCAEFVPVDMEA